MFSENQNFPTTRKLNDRELDTVTGGDTPMYGTNLSLNENLAINEGILLSVAAGIAKGISKAFGG